MGTPFRLQGRTPGEGLDCVGVAAAAFAIAAVPCGYALRGGDPAAVAAAVERAGLVRAAGMRPGDLLLLRPGARQLHLAVLVPGGFVHADAGLGRVVETPGVPRWPLIGAWRMTGKGKG